MKFLAVEPRPPATKSGSIGLVTGGWWAPKAAPGKALAVKQTVAVSWRY